MGEDIRPVNVSMRHVLNYNKHLVLRNAGGRSQYLKTVTSSWASLSWRCVIIMMTTVISWLMKTCQRVVTRARRKHCLLASVTPEAACNGADDNCDGDVDDGKEMEDTDILFIIDWSGSMSDEIQAVMTALNLFASNYSDEEVIKWGVIIGPVPGSNPNQVSWQQPEFLLLASDLVDFQQFMGALAGLSPNLFGGTEMLYDAVYLAIHNLVPTVSLPWPISTLSWEDATGFQEAGSYPPLGQFEINWRDDANHVVIVFTDEEGQSYLWKNMNDPGNEMCGITENELILTIQNAIDLSMYTFTPEGVKGSSGANPWPGQCITGGGWESLTQFLGKWYKLTSNAAIMYENLLEILDDTACSD